MLSSDKSPFVQSPGKDSSPVPASKLPSKEASVANTQSSQPESASSAPEEQVQQIPLGEQWGVKETGEVKTSEEIPRESRHYLRGIIIFLVIVTFLVGAIYAAYSTLVTRTAAPEAAAQIFHEGRIYTGQAFLVKVTVHNFSGTPFQNAKVILNLPEDIYIADSRAGERRSAQEDIGDMAPGEAKDINFSLVAAGEGQMVKTVSAVFSYASQAEPKLVYEKKSTLDLPVGQSTAALSFSTPSSVYSGEPVRIVIKYQNNSALPLKNAKLELMYPLPPSFTFTTSTTPAVRGNNLFDLGLLAPGSSQSMVIEGVLTGPDKGFLQFHAALMAEIYGVSRVISGQEATVTIKRRPLDVEVAPNIEADGVVSPGNVLAYKVIVRNNSPVVMAGVQVKATITSLILDIEKIDVQDGVFNSKNKTISWNSGSVKGLAAISPGSSVTMSFRLGILEQYPGVSPTDKNYYVRVFAEAESPTVPQGTSAAKTYVSAESYNKIRGQFGVIAKALWRDAASKIINSGPYPPRVDEPTKYTIHWIAQSIGGDTENIVVKSSLPTGVSWTNVVKSTTTSTPVYNPLTSSVTWEIPNLSAGHGGTLPPAEAIFQVEATPSLSDLNRDIDLLGATTYTGVDSFTKIQQTGSDEALTTLLPDDATLGADRTVKK